MCSCDTMTQMQLLGTTSLLAKPPFCQAFANAECVAGNAVRNLRDQKSLDLTTGGVGLSRNRDCERQQRGGVQAGG
jgi:hypothetical protein